jgi:hypothetical protein
MSKADRRVDSAICLPLSGISHKLHAPERLGAHSSAGQSYRLITGWSLVRIQVGPPYLLFISPDPTIFLKELFYGDYINVR